jgi:hypothetical protein
MFDGLRGPHDGSVEYVLDLDLPGQIIRFADEAVNRWTFYAFRLTSELLENLAEAGNLGRCLLQMVPQRVRLVTNVEREHHTG